MVKMSTEKFSILTKGCILLCLTLLSFCPMPTDAFPTHLSRRQQDNVWGNTDSIRPILDFLDSIPGWLLGGGAVGTARELDASELPDTSLMTISPEGRQEEQPLAGKNSPASTKVPATQPPEDQSFYGVPKLVGDPVSNVKVPTTQPPEDQSSYSAPKPVGDPVSNVNPATQPDLGTVWVPKSRFGNH